MLQGVKIPSIRELRHPIPNPGEGFTPPLPLPATLSRWAVRAQKRVRPFCSLYLRPSWPILASLGPSWPHLGAIWGHLGFILGDPGAILAHLGAILGHLGAILGYLGAILAQLGPTWANFWEF